jgi:hypothetical protein
MQIDATASLATPNAPICRMIYFVGSISDESRNIRCLAELMGKWPRAKNRVKLTATDWMLANDGNLLRLTRSCACTYFTEDQRRKREYSASNSPRGHILIIHDERTTNLHQDHYGNHRANTYFCIFFKLQFGRGEKEIVEGRKRLACLVDDVYRPPSSKV